MAHNILFVALLHVVDDLHALTVDKRTISSFIRTVSTRYDMSLDKLLTTPRICHHDAWRDADQVFLIYLRLCVACYRFGGMDQRHRTALTYYSAEARARFADRLVWFWQASFTARHVLMPRMMLHVLYPVSRQRSILPEHYESFPCTPEPVTTPVLTKNGRPKKAARGPKEGSRRWCALQYATVQKTAPEPSRTDRTVSRRA